MTSTLNTDRASTQSPPAPKTRSEEDYGRVAALPMAALIAAAVQTHPPRPASAAAAAPREAEVLAIAQEDRPIREVARAVFLTPGTVRNYLATITQKLEAGLRAEAYRIARENGWI
jgi:DNA-binding CsgD family transcriptional regulator